MSTALAPTRLYELASALRELGELIEESGGELNETTEAALDALPGAFAAKVENVVKFSRELKLSGEMAKSEADRLYARSRAFGKASEGLLDYVRRTMEIAGERQVKTPLLTVTVCKVGTPVIEWPEGDDTIPEPFVRVTVERKLDKKAALAAYKAGTLPNGFDVAHGSYLRVS